MAYCKFKHDVDTAAYSASIKNCKYRVAMRQLWTSLHNPARETLAKIENHNCHEPEY